MNTEFGDKNNPPEEMHCVVDSVIYQNPANGYTVLELSCKGEVFTAVGVFSDVAEGEELDVKGQWASHPTYGRQFSIESCQRRLPDTSAKLFHYLSSGAVKGIGPKLAAKIIKEFGDESFDVLERFPERLAVIPGISKKKAVEICGEFNQKFAIRKVMLELEVYGIKPSESAAIYKRFGINAVERIRENPYILCSEINGFTFERVEKLAADMELTPEAFDRCAAGLVYILTHNLYSNGHTCIPREKLSAPGMDLLGVPEEEIVSAIDRLLQERRLISAGIDGTDFLFLPDIYAAERSISERLRRSIRYTGAASETSDALLDGIEKDEGIVYAEKQRQAIRTAADKGLLILTGGPGTGKTTTVRGIIEVLERKNVHVLLCAPTGMAAKRMSEVTGRDAKTIHRLLEVEWTEDHKPAFRRNAQNPLTCGAIVVDEVSMVDVELMASLLEALPLGCRIILVGDSDQLPSVGPGCVLSDIISSGVMPVVRLTEIFRQAQKSLIVMNAHRIIGGAMPVLDKTDNDFFFIGRTDGPATASTVADLVSRRLPEAYGFSPFSDIQVLCPSKRGDCGTAAMNNRLQAILNPAHRSKNELRTTGGRVFREGDRVMQIKNNYDLHWKKGSEENDGIFNGDIGVIEKINFLTSSITIDFDGRITDYPADNLSELDLAYAITVHKSQGSEYPVVVLPLIDCPYPLLYRNLLYTAVTRSRKILIIVGAAERIARMVENNKTNKRYSALKAFLKD